MGECTLYYGYIYISQTLKYAKYDAIRRLARISGLRNSVKVACEKKDLQRNGTMAYIDDELIQSLRKWFNEYVETFCTDQSDIRENILLKQKHTKRVCGEVLRIGRSLGVSGESLRFAEITALFHDVGRFEQYVRYRTFVDHKSVNHAALSVRTLKDNGVLDRLNDSIKDLVYRIISYHNRPFLPNSETDTCLFYTKLLRDADKLDIWRVMTRYYRCSDGSSNSAIELELPDTPEISDKVYDAVINKRIVDIHHIQTFNDFKVLQIGWIFDVNFKPTIDAVISRNYINDICSVLPASDKVKTIKKVVNHYVEKDFVEEKCMTSLLELEQKGVSVTHSKPIPLI